MNRLVLISILMLAATQLKAVDGISVTAPYEEETIPEINLSDSKDKPVIKNELTIEEHQPLQIDQEIELTLNHEDPVKTSVTEQVIKRRSFRIRNYRKGVKKKFKPIMLYQQFPKGEMRSGELVRIGNIALLIALPLATLGFSLHWLAAVHIVGLSMMILAALLLLVAIIAYIWAYSL